MYSMRLAFWGCGPSAYTPARFDVAEVYTDVHRSAGKTRIAYIENAF